MTNRELYDRFFIEVRRGKFKEAEAIKDQYQPVEWWEPLRKEEMKNELDWYTTGQRQDFTSAVTNKHLLYEREQSRDVSTA
jgi:hypothetical protein